MKEIQIAMTREAAFVKQLEEVVSVDPLFLRCSMVTGIPFGCFVGWRAATPSVDRGFTRVLCRYNPNDCRLSRPKM